MKEGALTGPWWEIALAILGVVCLLGTAVILVAAWQQFRRYDRTIGRLGWREAPRRPDDAEDRVARGG